MTAQKATSALLDEYLSGQSNFKKRRVAGVIVIALFLLVPILVVWFNGWMTQLGNGVGVRWLIAGLVTVALTILVPIVDVLYRGWL